MCFTGFADETAKEMGWKHIESRTIGSKTSLK